MKVCRNCENQFEISLGDIEFYKKIDVPEPLICPDCRIQKRAAHRNERSLYKRKCDLCNCEMISVFPAESDFVVYCNKCWWSDKWDIMDYGQDFDFNRPFFEQFNELQKVVPHYALFLDGTSENCDYTNFGMGNKNCYMSVCVMSEDVYYSDEIVECKSCISCQKCVKCELCYDCIDCNQSYNLLFSQDCQNCNNSYFLKDCIGCSDCFCSVGLRNAQYYFCNQKLSEEEYLKKVEAIEFTDSSILEWKNKRDEISLRLPKKYLHGNGNVDVSGDYLDNCKNIKQCFDCLGLEDSSYCVFSGYNTRNIYDCTNTGMGSELCYQTDGGSNFHNCKCVFFGRNLSDCEYCKYCFASEFLFGCIGLNHKKYCIFNKQYSEDEFLKLKGRIIDHMRSEYGEYFPIEISPYAYNETKAQDYYPLTKEEALAKGYKWRDRSGEVLERNQDQGLSCEDCSQNYRIIKQEQDFYEKFKLPGPKKCPECRNMGRRVLRNHRRLWDRKCMGCETFLKTSYSVERPEKVYCEECYLELI
ncbi:zinc-ribbon domain containing protein [Patescibacteria group bacterium]